MTTLSNINYFKELPFFNVSIDKPKIKRLANINLLHELPFCKRLSVIKKIKHLVDMQDHTKLK